MAKDQTKSMSRAEMLKRTMRSQRTWLGVTQRDGRWQLPSFLHLPRVGWGLLICMALTLLGSALTIWARERPIIAVGRVMNETRTVRVPLDIEDTAATLVQQDKVRQRVPRVYVADTAAIDDIRSALLNLPKTLAAVTDLEQVDPGIREQFGLTVERLDALKAETGTPDGLTNWENRVQTATSILRARPFLDKSTWQRSSQEGLHTEVKLIVGAETLYVPRSELVNVEDPARLAQTAEIIARDAGFVGPRRQIVVSRLTTFPKPTFRFDEAATATDQNAAVARVGPEIQTSAPGQVIYRRGDVLTGQQYDLYKAELAEYYRTAGTGVVWTRRLSLAAGVGAIVLAIAAYAALFAPRIRQTPGRMAGVGLLLAFTMALAVVGTAADPGLKALTAVAPTIFAAIIICIAFDQRVALAYGCLHAVLVCVALDLTVPMFALIVAGVGCAVWRLSDLRDRATLVRMALATAAALAIGTVVVGLMERPIAAQPVKEIFVDSGLAAAAALLVGGVVLFILPTIERAFGITTGMTLVELRDPRHPLLRELQQRAPGTYNHSLNVAAIAEAAADAVGGNALLTYVGALYHDIGKMNKPEYFVENQSGGPNKHDKLSPAMSLLVIVGHVKDGLELAREFGLPVTVQHFIESHHGTTLVEYFYHRARKLAEQRAVALARGADAVRAAPGGDDDNEPDEVPDEFEYRYPGPKPQTREAAIVMLCDAIESATRTMAEPTPSRIDALVRSMANKRLLDGQFEDCEMTLKDLNTIAESISKSVASIYHGRITYQSTATVAKRA